MVVLTEMNYNLLSSILLKYVNEIYYRIQIKYNNSNIIHYSVSVVQYQ